MSADGEVEVKVSADGADQAAEDLSDGSATSAGGGGGGGGGEQQGILGRSLRGGALLAAILAVVELLGPLGDFISATLEVLQAFLAPIALILVRLMAPFLRLMVTRVLPAWLSFMQWLDPAVDLLVGFVESIASLMGMVFSAIVSVAASIWSYFKSPFSTLHTGIQRAAEYISNLPPKMWSALQRGFEWIQTQVSLAARYLERLPGRIWSFVQRLPRMIGNVISNRIPNIPSSAGGAVDTAVRTFEGATGIDAPSGREFGQTVINLTGGLGAFVEQVQRDNNITLP